LYAGEALKALQKRKKQAAAKEKKKKRKGRNARYTHQVRNSTLQYFI
jgi:hypothetical protein